MGKPWSPLPARWAAAAATVLFAFTACGAADDAARVVVASRSAVDDAARYGDDLARAARAAAAADAAAARAVQRVDDAASRVVTEDEEVRRAVDAVAWDTFCDVVTGNGPGDASAVPAYLVGQAASFGVEFLDGAEHVLAQALLASLDTPGEASDASAACGRLPTAAP